METDALSYIAAHFPLTGADMILLIVTPLEFGYPGWYAYLPPGIAIGGSGFTMPVALLSGNGFGDFRSWGFAGGVAHELGHTMGFLHTAALQCQSWMFDIPAALTDPRYSATDCWPGSRDALLIANDRYDFMGGYYGHPNSFQKWQAGWLGPTQVIDAPTGGSFVLEEYEPATAGQKAVRVQMGNDAEGAPVWYWLEYRAKPIVNLDTGAVTTTDRVFVWLNLPNLPDSNSSSVFEFAGISLSGPQRNTHLASGETFTDPHRGLRVRRGSDSTSQGVKRTTVSVQRSGLKFDPPIGLKIGPYQTRSIRLTNTGTTVVSISSVALKGRHPAAFQKVSDTCSGIALAPLATCRVSVAYAVVGRDGDTEYAHLQWSTDDSLAPAPTVGLLGIASYHPKRRAARH